MLSPLTMRAKTRFLTFFNSRKRWELAFIFGRLHISQSIVSGFLVNCKKSVGHAAAELIVCCLLVFILNNFWILERVHIVYKR